jgi:ribosomal protein L35AE/L33A
MSKGMPWPARSPVASNVPANVRSSRHVSHKRAKRNTTPNTSLLQIEGVGTKEAARYVEAGHVDFDDAYVSRFYEGK